jgi:hypothetical protein
MTKCGLYLTSHTVSKQLWCAVRRGQYFRYCQVKIVDILMIILMQHRRRSAIWMSTSKGSSARTRKKLFYARRFHPEQFPRLQCQQVQFNGLLFFIMPLHMFGETASFIKNSWNKAPCKKIILKAFGG